MQEKFYTFSRAFKMFQKKNTYKLGKEIEIERKTLEALKFCDHPIQNRSCAL